MCRLPLTTSWFTFSQFRLDEESEEGSDLPETVPDKSELDLVTKKKTVKWKDDKETNLVEEEEDVGKEGEDEETVPTIHFSHSEVLPVSRF